MGQYMVCDIEPLMLREREDKSTETFWDSHPRPSSQHWAAGTMAEEQHM